MKKPTMVYKFPGSQEVHRPTKKRFDSKTVEGHAEEGEESEHQKALADGWYPSLHAAIEAHEEKGDNAPPTRAELETKAKELGIEFDDSTDDELLSMQIEEAISGTQF